MDAQIQSLKTAAESCQNAVDKSATAAVAADQAKALAEQKVSELKTIGEQKDQALCQAAQDRTRADDEERKEAQNEAIAKRAATEQSAMEVKAMKAADSVAE